MKFQKYLREVASEGPPGLQHLNYKLLKAEVKELRGLVEAGALPRADAEARFAARLREELALLERHWARHVQLLGDRLEEFFNTADLLLRGDFTHEALRASMRPVALLEPLRPWLELAAWADNLRRHRLLQAAAVVKIEKKFVKAMDGCQAVLGGDMSSMSSSSSADSGRRGVDAAGMLRRSALGGEEVHVLCRQLEAVGDTLLRLGLGTARPEAVDPCAICLGGIVDPARLPCSHRFCVHCVLPLFDACEAGDPGAGDAAMLKCPLCRAVGPAAPQALSLDGLLPRMERGLSPSSCKLYAKPEAEEWRFTAVVVSSLARLAAHDAGCIPPSPSVNLVRGCIGGGATGSPKALPEEFKHQPRPARAADFSEGERPAK